MNSSKRLFLFVLAGFILVSCGGDTASPIPSEVTVSKDVLKDKILGAWAGQIIGCTYGGPTEFLYSSFIDRHVEIPWGEHYIKEWYDKAPGLYDDVYMDLTFVDVFEKEGLDAPIESFAEAFAYAPYPLWHANAQARYNIMQGIMPPASGYWENNPHADDIDFQIEADYAGIMAPGMVNAAVRFTDGIGHIMNYGDGWYGGVYVAAMYALAFVSDDMDFITSEALKVIPQESRYHQAMADIIRWHELYPQSWEETWLHFNMDYGFDIGCPDGVLTTIDIDAVLNSGYILIGLLYGEKDFFRTIDISTRCGADSDCNPASAGGILGTILGYGAIPEYWRKPVEEVADIPLVYTDISLNRAAGMSFGQALQVIEREGGSVSGENVVIRTESPETVRLEKGFENHWPTGLLPLSKPIGEMPEITFTGTGAVIRYEFLKTPGYVKRNYVAEVEVFLDGESCGIRNLPAEGRGMSPELFFRYNLPSGGHTISLRWLNREDDIDIRLRNAVIYSDTHGRAMHP